MVAGFYRLDVLHAPHQQHQSTVTTYFMQTEVVKLTHFHNKILVYIMCWMRHPASTTYFHESAMTISLQDSEKLDYSRTTEQKQTDSITHLSRIASEIFNN